MNQKQFGELAVTRLGDLVGELKLKGMEAGVSESEIKEVWQTIFKIMANRKTGQEIRKEVSQNLKTLLT